jgi:error-prone DNA polymerase
MAAWKRGGGLEHFRGKIVERMTAKGYPLDYIERIIEQIKGFGSYGFPESHAASFALLAYVSSWLKCHEPAAFACALLNSLPMGFYGPAQIVADLRRHDVEVRAVDATVSAWDCTLECVAHASLLPPGDCKAQDAPANSEAGPEAERHGWRESGGAAAPDEGSAKAGRRSDLSPKSSGLLRATEPSPQPLSRRERG